MSINKSENVNCLCGSVANLDYMTMNYICSNRNCTEGIDHRTAKKERVATVTCPVCGERTDSNELHVCSKENHHTGEKTMVEGLEGELLKALSAAKNPGPSKEGVFESPLHFVGVVSILSSLIDARIELNRVQMLPIDNIEYHGPKIDMEYVKKVIRESKDSIYFRKDESINDSIDSSLDMENLEALPAFIPLKDFTPEQFATIRNGDRFNVAGRTMHVRFEKEYIPGLRSLKVIKGSD